MRMIDADELKTAFPTCDNSKSILIASVRATINHMPTIERKTGKWIKKDCDLLYCSECDLPSLHPWPYCERCGAKMEV